jgi:glycosyltransferase involved in cell wall biosynthesis
VRVCFIVDLPSQTMGGSEQQCYLISKGLAARGWNMSCVTGFGEGYGTQILEAQLGFPVYHLPSSTQPHARRLRAFAYLLLFRTLRQVNPDIVLVAYGGLTLSMGGLYSLLYRKKFIYYAGGIMDSDLPHKKYSRLRDFGFFAWRFHAFFVRRADAILTNAEWVADGFRSQLPNKIVLVIQNGQEIEFPKPRQASHVLWLARMNRVKGPRMFVELAKKLPDIRFVMAGGGPLQQQLAKEASRVSNLTLTDTVTGKAKENLLASSFVLVNTSLAEGFPNTLIEAGMNRVPYISFVDPDEVVCRYELGYHVKSFQELVEKTRLLVKDKTLRTKLGSNIREYVEKEHDIKKTVTRYDKFLKNLH